MMNILLISLCWGATEPTATSSTRLFAPVSSDLQRRAVEDIEVDQEMPLSNTNLTGYTPRETVVKNVVLPLSEQIGKFSEQEAQALILKVETSLWHSIFRWATADQFLQRLAYLTVLDPYGIILADDDQGKKCIQCPVLLSGGSLPIASDKTRKKVLFVDGFRQGLELILFRGLTLSISALAMYQLYNYFQRSEYLPCQKQTNHQGFEGFFEFWGKSQNTALLGLFHSMFEDKKQTIWECLLSLPLVGGLASGALNTSDSAISNEEIQKLLQELRLLEHGHYSNLVRWLLPLHPIGRKLNTLMKSALWNTDISPDNLQQTFDLLKELCSHRYGYTSIFALSQMMRFVCGYHEQDVHRFYDLGNAPQEPDEADLLIHSVSRRNSSHIPSDTRLNQFRKLKRQALCTLQDAAEVHHNDGERKSIIGHATGIYAQYLLWYLGMPRSWQETIVPTIFKGGKLYIQGKFLYAIINSLIETLNCPRQAGVSLAGVEPWANDLTKACFDATIQTFNIIPGQPTDTIVDNLGQYYFQDCKVSLDLSNKNLDGAAIFKILKALFDKNLTVTFLDLSGNRVNTANDFQKIFPLLSHLSTLNISNNGIGLQNETKMLGDGLVSIPNLTSLDLSYNWIEFKQLAEIFSQLSTLVNLNISYNSAYLQNMALLTAQSLSSLQYLTTLDLSGNTIQYIGYDEAKNLKYPISLKNLYLRDNWIGNGLCYPSDAGVILANWLSNLLNLQILDLSFNNIHSTSALANGLRKLRNLTVLDLSYNWIGLNTSYPVEEIAEAISTMPQLRVLKLFPNPVDNNGIVAFNKALNHTVASQFLLHLRTPADVDFYCQSLPYDVRDIDLSFRLYDPNSTTMAALMQCLQTFKFLVSLNISHGSIDLTPSGGSKALGEGLSHLPNLETLDLSWNWIGIGGNSWTCTNWYWGEDWGQSGANQTRELIAGFPYLTNLKHLDLSHNWFGALNSDGVVTLAQNLRYLSNLTTLRLSYVDMDLTDSKGTVDFGKTLRHLTNLKILDLSYNKIGFNNSNGTIELGKGLSFLSALEVLDLSYNNIGLTDSQGTVELGKSLFHLPYLKFLDLSNNSLGFADSNGILELALGLNHTRKLTVLKLGRNKIGSTGPEGPTALLSVLPNLVYLNSEVLNLQNMTNVVWTKAAAVLQHLRSENLMSQCQITRCFGGDVSINQGTPPISQQLAFSQRNAMALDAPEIRPATSGAYFPSSSFWGEAAKGVSTIYRTMFELAEHPEMQRIGWAVVGSKLAYATFQTWPLLATYAMLA